MEPGRLLSLLEHAGVTTAISFKWIRNSKLVGYSDVGKCHVTGWAGVFEEPPGKKTSEVDIHRRVRVQCPKDFAIWLTPYVPRFTSSARAQERSSDLIDTVVEAFTPEPTPIESASDVLERGEYQHGMDIEQVVGSEHGQLGPEVRSSGE